MDIVRGHIYRAKRPKPVVSLVTSTFDDRQVIFATKTRVQYDSPTVSNGRRYPTIDRVKFENWAGQDVTEGYPHGHWMPWDGVTA